MVNTYAKIETERLNYIRYNQCKLWEENYIYLQDSINNDIDPKDIGRLVVLSSSFTGSPRYIHQRIQDAITYVELYRKPELFITLTCNPNWPEIKENRPVPTRQTWFNCPCISSKGDNEETVNFPTEFFNSQTSCDMPSHKISLKILVPIMLLRNLNSFILCNETRLHVTSLTKNLIEVEILIRCAVREKIFLPKIPLYPNDFPTQFRKV